MESEQPPVLIIGAGLVGLALGQALKRASIPFRIYERDASLTTRRQGWAITLHWALSFLPELLPDDVLARLVSSAQVDPANGAGGHDGGNFLFLDLRDCSVKFKIPPNRRWRLHREKARAALLCGLEDRVVWGARVVDVVVQQSLKAAAERPTIVFEDGTTATGRLVVGIDGSRSRIRQVLAPATFRNEQLPLRFTGVAVDMTAEAIAPLRALDPLLFQGLHPPTRTFMWYSVLETPPPAANGTTEKETSGGSQEQGKTYRAQLNMSWPVEGPGDEVAETDAARLEFMKQRARHFDPRLRRVWEGIPEGTVVTEVKLADWPCLEWDNRNGRVTLASDAAHAMTMYRGEAANHGLLDALLLVRALKKVYSGEVEQQEAIDEYEKEMRKRAGPAVLMSRQACYDAHTWESLTEDCAVLRRRAIESLP